MNKKYLIRLDDACPTMDREKWERIEKLFDKYGILPMVGVIPHNEDPKQLIDEADISFWNKIKKWEQKGWAIALHGYNHCYTSNLGKKGLNPMWDRSEFAGLPLSVQSKKVRDGVAIMRGHEINPRFFFAPSHTFDENTINALRDESDIRVISDTIATKPYRYKDFFFIPQISGQCRKIRLPGLFTFCLHPNTMDNTAFIKIESFLIKYSEFFTAFDSINLDNVGKKTIIDRLLYMGYFAMRKVRGK